MSARIVVIDNYDSFTFNLVQYLGELGASLTVFRNDEISIAALAKMRPDGLLVSPGPKTPNEAGLSVAAIAALHGELPILGVCLGHQSLAVAFGGRVSQSRQIMHGKTSEMLHTGRGIFESLPNPFAATRYHSLEIARQDLPECFEVHAWTKDDELMAIKHRDAESWGVQFHPESILTLAGKSLLRNFLAICGSDGKR
jgi:para-aminobenzoate synthetase component 2